MFRTTLHGGSRDQGDTGPESAGSAQRIVSRRLLGARMIFPNAPADSFEGILRFPLREDAVAKAAHLRDDTALAWTVEFRPDTDRFHVGLDGRSSQLVTVAPGRHDAQGPRISARLWSPIRSCARLPVRECRHESAGPVT